MNVRLDNITIKCMLAIMLSALFASCKDEMDEYEGGRPSRMDVLGMKFTTLYDGFEKPTTRAIIESVADIDQVCVLSMKKKDDDAAWSQVFDNDTLVITNVGDEIWYYPTEKKKKWEADYNYKFRAFYPYKFNTGAGESCDGFTWAGFSIGQTELRLNNYKSASNPRNNSDLLVSQSVEREKGETNVVALEMKHLMACVDFKFKAKKGQKVTITKFTVNGYAGEGSCVCNEGSDPDWTAHSGDITNRESVTIWTILNNGEATGELYYDTQSKFKFIDLASGQEVSVADMKAKLDKWYDPSKPYKYDFYAVFIGMRSASESLGKLSYSFNADDELYTVPEYQGLLFVPQKLGVGDKYFDLTVQSYYNNYWNEWNNEIQATEWKGHPGNLKTLTFDNVLFKNSTSAEIEYYFGDDSAHPYTATVDLSAGNSVTEWEAGKKYTYTIGINHFDVNVDIVKYSEPIEDWRKHTNTDEIQ